MNKQSLLELLAENQMHRREQLLIEVWYGWQQSVWGY